MGLLVGLWLGLWLGSRAWRVAEVMCSARLRMKPQQKAPRLRPRIKIWMQCASGLGFGSRFVAILEAVDRTGSIKHAAADLGWSYRHLWSRIKRVEAALGCTLVSTKLGGRGTERSALTPAGRGVVARFHELRTRLLKLAARDADFANP